MKKSIWGAVLLILPAAGILCVHSATENPSPNVRPFDPELRLPPLVAATIARSCADCHSQGTRWPWYARLPVIGPEIRADVTRGRSMMDFSNWSARTRDFGPAADFILSAACEEMRSHRMPLPKYLWLHPEARPNDEDIRRFCSWAQNRATAAANDSAKFTSFSQHHNPSRGATQ